MQTCTPWTVVSRSWLMSVIMTFMFEPAKLQMNWARASGISIFRNDGAMLLLSAALSTTAPRTRSTGHRASVAALRIGAGPTGLLGLPVPDTNEVPRVVGSAVSVERTAAAVRIDGDSGLGAAHMEFTLEFAIKTR